MSPEQEKMVVVQLHAALEAVYKQLITPNPNNIAALSLAITAISVVKDALEMGQVIDATGGRGNPRSGAGVI